MRRRRFVQLVEPASAEPVLLARLWVCVAYRACVCVNKKFNVIVGKNESSVTTNDGKIKGFHYMT